MAKKQAPTPRLSGAVAKGRGGGGFRVQRVPIRCGPRYLYPFWGPLSPLPSPTDWMASPLTPPTGPTGLPSVPPTLTYWMAIHWLPTCYLRPTPGKGLRPQWPKGATPLTGHTGVGCPGLPLPHYLPDFPTGWPKGSHTPPWPPGPYPSVPPPSPTDWGQRGGDWPPMA